MNLRKVLWLFPILCIAVSCSPRAPVSQPAATVTAVAASPIPSTETALPATAAATTPAEPQLITAQNAAGLVSTPLALPEFPQRFLWPSTLPEALPPADLLVESQGRLHPVLFDPPGLGQPVPLPLNGNTLVDAAPDGSTVAVQDPSQFALFDLSGRKTVDIGISNPYGARYSRDGDFIAVTERDQWAVSVYDARTGRLVNRLTGFETAAPVYSAMVSPDGKTLAWIARATLQLQDVETGEMGKEFRYVDFIEQAVFSPDSQALALTAGTRLEIYRLPAGEALAGIELSQPIRSLDFSPDGTMLAAAYGSGIQIWDAVSWQPVALLDGGGAGVSMVAFSPDGQTLVSTDENMQLLIWRAR